MASESLTLVVNPGSASRKYAIFANGYRWANINFEFVDNKITGKIEHAGQQHPIICDDVNLDTVSHHIMPSLLEHNVISNTDKITTIGIRIVAPSRRFMQDQLITDEVEIALDALHEETPLHIRAALLEIRQLRASFSEVPIIAISDSAFHASKPPRARHYGVDVALVEKFGIERYGYHGLSVGSVVRYLTEYEMLLPNTIVCHLGSGSSVTAVGNGESVDNTMGYSPLEGLMMATRSGSIDVSAALVIRRELHLTDEELEQYLDKKSGLLGVSGSSDDIRQLLASEEKGDERAKLALDIFVYRIQQAIGQMVASLGGVDSLVFTATIGERSSIIRGRVLDRLGYLGFTYDPEINKQTFEPSEATNIAIEHNKPVLVISTDEATEIARRAEQYIKNQQ
jgi:acetate kinase